MKKVVIVTSLIWSTLSIHLYAQTVTDTVKLKLDLPLFDLPYQMDAKNAVGGGFFGSYANPSMSQSLAVTTDMFSAFHYGMKHFYENSNIRKRTKRLIYTWGTALGDFILFYFPGGDWLHPAQDRLQYLQLCRHIQAMIFAH